MDKKELIKVNPTLAISFLDEKKNEEFAKTLASSIK
jgi:hypothetical protein